MLDEKLSLFVEVDFNQKFCDAIEKSINLSLNTYYIAYNVHYGNSIHKKKSSKTKSTKKDQVSK